MDNWNEKVCTLYPYNVIIKGLAITPKMLSVVQHRLFIGDECVDVNMALHRLLYLHDKPITHLANPLDTLIELLGKVNVARACMVLKTIVVNTSNIMDSRLGIADALFRCSFKQQSPSDDKDLFYNPFTQLNYKTPGNFPYSSIMLRIACHEQQLFYHYLFVNYGLTKDVTDDVQTIIKEKERVNMDTQQPITLENLKRLKYYHEKSGIGTDSQSLYYRILPFLEIHTSKPQRKAIPKAIKTTLWDKYYPGKLIGPCYTCGNSIDARHFEAGHVIPASDGGPDTVDNLRPICKPCNASMSNTHLYAYKEQYYPKSANKPSKTIEDDFVIIIIPFEAKLDFHPLYRTLRSELVDAYKEWCISNSCGYVFKELEELLLSRGCAKEVDGKAFYCGVRMNDNPHTPINDYQSVFDRFVKKYKNDDTTKVLRDLRRLNITSSILREMIASNAYPSNAYPSNVIAVMKQFI